MVQVEVTPAAYEQVVKIMSKEAKPGAALRLYVQGGGCSGLTYGMTFDRPESGDEIAYQRDALTVVVDRASAPLLEGLKVDYLLGLEASGFKITNPNAKQTCSCGKSFSA
jgi:iron-sulfur cluster assembly protein